MGQHRFSSLQKVLPGIVLPATEEKRHKRPLKQCKIVQNSRTDKEKIQTDLFSLPLLPPLRTRFLPDEIRLTRISSLAATCSKETDDFLYHVADVPMASLFLQEGLPLNTRHPLMLTEQNGLGAWLSKIADYDPDDFSEPAVILRLRRVMVEDALEPDPDHTAEFASRCYLLSGNSF